MSILDQRFSQAWSARADVWFKQGRSGSDRMFAPSLLVSAPVSQTIHCSVKIGWSQRLLGSWRFSGQSARTLQESAECEESLVNQVFVNGTARMIDGLFGQDRDLQGLADKNLHR